MTGVGEALFTPCPLLLLLEMAGGAPADDEFFLRMPLGLGLDADGGSGGRFG
jgi:hypothetical protein